MATNASDRIEDDLRQMIAVLEDERQALAALDLDGVVETRRSKEALCDAIAAHGPIALGDKARELARTARQLNDINRRVRNVLAANVEARLKALCPDDVAYRAPRSLSV